MAASLNYPEKFWKIKNAFSQALPLEIRHKPFGVEKSVIWPVSSSWGCICMCMSVFMCVQVCEPNDIHVGAWDWHQVSFYITAHLISNSILTELEACLCNVDETGWPVSPRDLLCPLSIRVPDTKVDSGDQHSSPRACTRSTSSAGPSTLPLWQLFVWLYYSWRFPMAVGLNLAPWTCKVSTLPLSYACVLITLSQLFEYLILFP